MQSNLPLTHLPHIADPSWHRHPHHSFLVFMVSWALCQLQSHKYFFHLLNTERQGFQDDGFTSSAILRPRDVKKRLEILLRLLYSLNWCITSSFKWCVSSSFNWCVTSSLKGYATRNLIGRVSSILRILCFLLAMNCYVSN